MKFAPNALLRSERNPPVTYKRSLNATFSSTKPPSVLVSLVDSSAVVTAPEVTVVAPGGSLVPVAPLRSKKLRLNCTPALVFDWIVAESCFDAVALASAA